VGIASLVGCCGCILLALAVFVSGCLLAEDAVSSVAQGTEKIPETGSSNNEPPFEETREDSEGDGETVGSTESSGDGGGEEGGEEGGEDPDPCEADLFDDACSSCEKSRCCEVLTACVFDFQCSCFMWCSEPYIDDFYACVDRECVAVPWESLEFNDVLACRSNLCTQECVDYLPK